jgi:hypothetical protein
MLAAFASALARCYVSETGDRKSIATAMIQFASLPLLSTTNGGESGRLSGGQAPLGPKAITLEPQTLLNTSLAANQNALLNIFGTEAKTLIVSYALVN